MTCRGGTTGQPWSLGWDSSSRGAPVLDEDRQENQSGRSVSTFGL